MSTSTGAISRLIPQNDTSRIVTLTQLVLDDNWRLEIVDALIALPGMGEHDRISVPAQLYNESKARHLIVGGAHTVEHTYVEHTQHSMRQAPYGLRRPDGILAKATCVRTIDQIDWSMLQAQEHEVTSVAIFTHPYHLLRAFGTAIKSLERLGVDRIPIIPVAVGSPFDPVPELFETGEHGYDMVAAETKGYFDYVATGMVASYEEILDFMLWMRTEHKDLVISA